MTEAGSQHTALIVAWENEGGALGPGATNDPYGRRVEADRSWTIYHVFTGVPVQVDGQAQIGLSRSDATAGMLAHNRHNAGPWTD